MRLFTFGLLAFLFIPSAAQKKPITLDQKIKEFEAYILKSQKEWEVPGLAVAVVKNGTVLLSKGFGVRELGTSKVVDAQTLFACASTTKAMTAVCMGMLVDEGNVKWDDAVIDHLPEFHLYDPFVTSQIKVRDLFVHNTGVGNADFLWSIMNISSDEVLAKMREVKPSYSLRSSFIYQNIFYLAAGKIIEKVSGQKWDRFIRQRIFQPLKMTRTVPLLADVKDANQSRPHFNMEGKITVIDDMSADNIGPAGSAWSSIEDMEKWMQCMLDSGKHSGGRLLSATTWSEMFRPQVLVPTNEFYPTMQLTKPNWTTYGLGWFQHDYKGKKINFHTGSLAGTVAIHAQLPDEQLGIYVFANYDHAELRHALVYKAFDYFALGGTRDWSMEFLKLYKNIQAGNDNKIKEFEAKRTLNTKPSVTMTAYEGKYSDPLYGQVVVTLEDDRLLVNANNFLRASVAHWHYDTFRGWYGKKWYGQAIITFSIGADGDISKVSVDGMEFDRAK